MHHRMNTHTQRWSAFSPLSIAVDVTSSSHQDHNHWSKSFSLSIKVIFTQRFQLRFRDEQLLKREVQKISFSTLFYKRHKTLQWVSALDVPFLCLHINFAGLFVLVRKDLLALYHCVYCNRLVVSCTEVHSNRKRYFKL